MGSIERLPILRTVDHVTKDWLSHVLDHPLSEAELTHAILHQTASKLLFTLSYTNEPETGNAHERPRHICVKGGFNPEAYDSEKYREVYKLLYTREALFFERLGPTLGKEILLPKVWGTVLDMAVGQGIIMMEDLNLAGVTFGSPLEAWSVDKVKLGVKQLALLHASTWGLEATGKNDWISPAYDNAALGMFTNWDAMIHGDDRPPYPAFFNNPKDWVMALFRKHYASRNSRFRCLLHGDPHMGNTFTDREGNLGFLDWQTVHIGSAFHDVAYFVVGVLPVEDRRTNEMEILHYYLEALHQFGGPKLDIDDPEVMLEFRKSCLSGASWSFCPYTMQSREAVSTFTTRYNAALEDHKVFELIESLPAV